MKCEHSYSMQYTGLQLCQKSDVAWPSQAGKENGDGYEWLE